MVSNLTLLAMIPSLLISLILPIVLIAVLARKNKGQKMISAWLLGAAGFFVTQILIRVPILTVLQTQDWFITFSQKTPFAYAFCLAFTAGLFELAGRFAVAKLMAKNLTFRRSLAAGLGHGGIEAILLIGMTYVNNLIYIVMINSGYFDYLIAQTAGLGVEISSYPIDEGDGLYIDSFYLPSGEDKAGNFPSKRSRVLFDRSMFF